MSKCPLGITDRKICSAGTCYECVVDRLKHVQEHNEMMRTAIETMLGRWYVYSGGADAPHAGETDKAIAALAGAALEHNVAAFYENKMIKVVPTDELDYDISELFEHLPHKRDPDE